MRALIGHSEIAIFWGGIKMSRYSFRILKLGKSMVIAVLLALFALGITACGDEEKFPERDIEWFVGFAAGGGFDVASRFIAKEMGTELGVNVVIRNIEGGGGRRAAQEISRGDTTGHQISIMNMPNQISAELLDPEGVSFSDLQWIGRAVIQTYGLYTTADSPYNTPADVAAADPEPRFCLSGLAGHSFLVASVTTEVMGIPWHPVTGYRGSETQAGLLRGDCELALGPFAGSTLSAIQGPDFKGLWMYTSERFAPTPDVPTVDELGFPELGGSKFANNGLVAAPPGTPDDVVDALAAAFQNALENPDVIAGINKAGMAVAPLSPDETDGVVSGMAEFIAQYIDVVRAKSQAQ